jgi:hypothetical protein
LLGNVKLFRRHVAALSILAVMTIGARPGFGQKQPTFSLVQIPVDTAYDDSQQNLDQLGRLVEVLPPRAVKFRPGDTISALITREYGFGPTNDLPKTYHLLEEAILRLNGLRVSEEALAGELLIPNVPRRALTKPGRSNKLNQIPKILHYIASQIVRAKTGRPAGTGGEQAAVTEFKFLGEPRILDQNRPAAQRALVEMPFPQEAVFASLKNKDFVKLAKILNLSMPVELARFQRTAEQTRENQRVLSEKESDHIRNILGTARREVVLFIIDTGWPNAESYHQSRGTLTRIFDRVWAEWKLGDQVKIASKRKKVAAFPEPENAHSQSVFLALEEFRRLDTAGKIKVVYVPLTRAQNATDVLVELVHLHLLAGLMGTQLGQVRPPREDFDHAREEAKKIVRNLPTGWPKEQNKVATDKVVLDAILDVGDLYAQKTGAAVFVNESWTVAGREYPVNYPSPFAGVVVAAVGNEYGRDVNLSLQNFAQRALEHKDTVAVMNMRKEEEDPICNSSRINDKYLNQAIMAFGFDGSLPEGGCATSFAAPRVAWLLAVSEAVRKENINPAVWENWLYERLNASHPNPKSYKALWFDLVPFLRPEEQ